MKYLLALLLFVPLLSIAQDKIFLRNGNTIEASVKKSTPKEIEYVFKGEETINVIEKNAIIKIEYESGRIEMVPYKYNEEPNRSTAAPTAINSHRKQSEIARFRIGPKGGILMPFFSNMGSSGVNQVGANVGLTSEVAFLKTGKSLLIDAMYTQLKARGSDDIGVSIGIHAIYMAFPILFNAQIGTRTGLSIGIEPSVLIDSQIDYARSYYDVDGITRGGGLGFTAGFRYFILPKRWFVDLRGTASVTDVYSGFESKPHRVSATLGYFIKY